MRLSPTILRVRAAVTLLAALHLLTGPSPARAQILYYDTDGAIINSDLSGKDIVVGSVNASPFIVNIENGAVTNFNNDFNDSVSGVDVRNQAQIAMTGGYVNALQLRDSSALMQSGGSMSNLYAGANVSVRLSGSGSLALLIALEQTRISVSGGILIDAQLYGDSTLEQIDGRIDRGVFQGSSQVSLAGGVLNFLTAQEFSRVTVSGGGGSGDWAALGAGKITVNGANLAVGSENARIRYDAGGLYSGRSADITGTLADGSNFQRTVYYGNAEISDGTQIALNGAERAPDLYAVTDQTATGLISTATLALNDVTGQSPTVAFDANALVGSVNVNAASVAQINGATIYGDVSLQESAAIRVNSGTIQNIFGYSESATAVTGGTIREMTLYGYATADLSGGQTGIVRGYENSVAFVRDAAAVDYVYLESGANLNVSGGTVRGLFAASNNDITISGGVIDGDIRLNDKSSLLWSGGSVFGVKVLNESQMIIAGSGLSFAESSETVLYDGAGLYRGAYFIPAGTLSDGSTLTDATVVFAANASGSDTSLTFIGANRAPNLFQTVNGDVSGFYSDVYIGRNSDATLQTSPIVTVRNPIHVGRIYALNSSRVAYEEGKTEGFIVASDRSSVDINGGDINNFQTIANSRATMMGGVIRTAYFQGESSVGIGGGAISSLTVLENATANLTGGDIGFGPDGGVFFLSGDLNIFGSDILLADGERFVYGSTSGIRYALTGILSSGDALNTRVFIADGSALRINPGATQESPYLTGAAIGGVFTFSVVPSNLWFAAPTVSAYDFKMIDGNLFTDILAFPTSFSGAFGVEVGGILLGSFTAGQSVAFTDYGFADGVTAFRITGIAPLSNAEDPNGFPVRLAFNNPFGSFTMQGVGVSAPEPNTLLFLICCIALTVSREIFALHKNWKPVR